MATALTCRDWFTTMAPMLRACVTGRPGDRDALARGGRGMARPDPLHRTVFRVLRGSVRTVSPPPSGRRHPTRYPRSSRFGRRAAAPDDRGVVDGRGPWRAVRAMGPRPPRRRGGPMGHRRRQGRADSDRHYSGDAPRRCSKISDVWVPATSASALRLSTTNFRRSSVSRAATCRMKSSPPARK